MRTLFKTLIAIGILIFLLPLLLSPLFILCGLCFPYFFSSGPHFSLGISHANTELVVIFVFVLAIVGMVFVVKVFRIIFEGSYDRDHKIEPNETQIMQEIHQGLSSMEKRIEALETILLDRSRRKGPD